MKKSIFLGVVLVAVFMSGCNSRTDPFKKYGHRNPYIDMGQPNEYCDTCRWNNKLCKECIEYGKKFKGQFYGVPIVAEAFVYDESADDIATGTGSYKSTGYNGVNNSSAGNAKKSWVKVDAFHRIKPNAYGLGTHMNQFGAPMKVVPVR